MLGSDTQGDGTIPNGHKERLCTGKDVGSKIFTQKTAAGRLLLNHGLCMAYQGRRVELLMQVEGTERPHQGGKLEPLWTRARTARRRFESFCIEYQNRYAEQSCLC